eukprot:g13223.t1
MATAGSSQHTNKQTDVPLLPFLRERKILRDEFALHGGNPSDAKNQKLLPSLDILQFRNVLLRSDFARIANEPGYAAFEYFDCKQLSDYFSFLQCFVCHLLRSGPTVIGPLQFSFWLHVCGSAFIVLLAASCQGDADSGDKLEKDISANGSFILPWSSKMKALLSKTNIYPMAAAIVFVSLWATAFVSRLRLHLEEEEERNAQKRRELSSHLAAGPEDESCCRVLAKHFGLKNDNVDRAGKTNIGVGSLGTANSSRGDEYESHLLHELEVVQKVPFPFTFAALHERYARLVVRCVEQQYQKYVREVQSSQVFRHCVSFLVLAALVAVIWCSQRFLLLFDTAFRETYVGWTAKYADVEEWWMAEVVAGSAVDVGGRSTSRRELLAEVTPFVLPLFRAFTALKQPLDSVVAAIITPLEQMVHSYESTLIYPNGFVLALPTVVNVLLSSYLINPVLTRVATAATEFECHLSRKSFRRSAFLKASFLRVANCLCYPLFLLFVQEDEAAALRFVLVSIFVRGTLLGSVAENLLPKMRIARKLQTMLGPCFRTSSRSTAADGRTTTKSRVFANFALERTDDYSLADEYQELAEAYAKLLFFFPCSPFWVSLGVFLWMWSEFRGDAWKLVNVKRRVFGDLPESAGLCSAAVLLLQVITTASLVSNMLLLRRHISAALVEVVPLSDGGEVGLGETESWIWMVVEVLEKGLLFLQLYLAGFMPKKLPRDL